MSPDAFQPPDWWDGPLAFTSHVEDRMAERGFSEVELRGMLDDATALVPSQRVGRWLVSTRLRRKAWIVVVEPDHDDRLIHVVTAYLKG